jgi:hypothetical protein
MGVLTDQGRYHTQEEVAALGYMSISLNNYERGERIIAIDLIDFKATLFILGFLRQGLAL